MTNGVDRAFVIRRAEPAEAAKAGANGLAGANGVASGRSAWERVKLARHPERPHTLDYIGELMSDFVELHGDRVFGDDQAMIGGLAKFGERTVLVLGHQKGGSNTRENLKRNFGMARPEGYRKAERLMRHAEKFGIPIVTFIDTPGAEPGIGSEERGQGTAIAESLLTMADLRTPIVAVVVGEGGSGGALAIGVADRILMLENAVYAVASPEACAAILWKDAGRAEQAAETMRITAGDLLAFGIIDEVIPERVPAHERPREAIASVGEAISRHLNEVMISFASQDDVAIDRLLERRFAKFRRIGVWREPLSSAPTLVRNLPDEVSSARGEEAGEIFDVFISHASEDKDDVVRPLAHALQSAGLSVWYDEFELHIGDKLRRKIDHGLANSRFGVVVLSPNFLAKRWPNYELDGIITKSNSGNQILLPIWHGISRSEVQAFSPSMAGIIARNTSDHEIGSIAFEIAELIRDSKRTS